MSADRELLELAAKAAHGAGLNVRMADELWYEGGDKIQAIILDDAGERMIAIWNPLTDDGDALRLSRHLKMTVAFEPSRGGWSVGAVVDGEFKWLAHDDDQCLAITLAAAAIGRSMP